MPIAFKPLEPVTPTAAASLTPARSVNVQVTSTAQDNLDDKNVSISVDALSARTTGTYTETHTFPLFAVKLGYFYLQFFSNAGGAATLSYKIYADETLVALSDSVMPITGSDSTDATHYIFSDLLGNAFASFKTRNLVFELTYSVPASNQGNYGTSVSLEYFQKQTPY